MSVILHNCYKASEDEVRSVPRPIPGEGQSRWNPKSHGESLDEILAAITRNGLEVVESSFALSGNKKVNPRAKAFGEFKVRPTVGNLDLPDDFGMAVGWRHSIDQTISHQIIGGKNVFVCGNMAFSGEFMETKRHTANADTVLPEKLDSALQAYLSGFSREVAYADLWKQTEVSQTDVDHAILECVRGGAFSYNHIPKVLDAWNAQPDHPQWGSQFKDRTVWSLDNALTEAQKHRKADPIDLADASIKATRTLRDLWPLAA